MEEKNFKIIDKWDRLEEAKRPKMCSELVTIHDWNGVEPKKHLWIKIKTHMGQVIVDSSMIIQLSKIIKKLQ